MAFSKTFYQPFAVLIRPSHQIIGDAAIKRSVLLTGHEIDEVHSFSMAADGLTGNVSAWVPRIKRGMTTFVGKSVIVECSHQMMALCRLTHVILCFMQGIHAGRVTSSRRVRTSSAQNHRGA